ncbi:unnamed protein product, partial [Prorocentrum cordatum]
GRRRRAAALRRPSPEQGAVAFRRSCLMYSRRRSNTSSCARSWRRAPGYW